MLRIAAHANKKRKCFVLYSIFIVYLLFFLSCMSARSSFSLLKFPFCFVQAPPVLHFLSCKRWPPLLHHSSPMNRIIYNSLSYLLHLFPLFVGTHTPGENNCRIPAILVSPLTGERHILPSQYVLPRDTAVSIRKKIIYYGQNILVKKKKCLHPRAYAEFTRVL